MDSDSSDSESGMMKKALHVVIPHDYDPTKSPDNGVEYLQSVMYETKMCPKVVVVPLDEKKKKNANYELPEEEESYKTSDDLIPSLEWQDQRVKDFIKFSKFLTTKISYKGDDVYISASTWIPVMNSRTPRFGEVTQFNQPSRKKLLKIILQEIEQSSTLEYTMGMWIYAILATMQLPLCPELCHQLRDLAKKCLKIRANLTVGYDEDSLKALNIIICLVARTYRQLDLADGGNINS